MNNPERITRSQLYERYGDVPVKFCSYYKYTFWYGATLPDGRTLAVGYGGDSGQIYRLQVDLREITVRNLEPHEGSVRVDGVEVETFYDY